MRLVLSSITLVFFYVLSYLIIIQMSISKQKLQQQIQNILDLSRLSLLEKFNHHQADRNQQAYDFDQFKIDNQEIQLRKYNNSPTKPAFLSNQSSFEKCQAFDRPSQSKTLINMHLLSSQMKEFRSRSPQKQAKLLRKLKKQKITQLISKANECINSVCQALHKSYSHLVGIWMGISTKFQVQSIYVNHLKAYLQENNRKLKQKMKTEELIDYYANFITNMMNRINSYQKKFVFPENQICIPQTSKLFKMAVDS